MKHVISRSAAALAVVAGAVLATGGTAFAAGLPTLSLAMDGTSISATGALQSGAVDIVSTVRKEAQGGVTLVRLNPGITPDQVYAFLRTRAAQDANTAKAYGSIVVGAVAPRGVSDVQADLAPGQYVAFDSGRQNPARWPHTTFTIAQAAQPATLPAPQATVRAIEFGFAGASTLRNGELVRFQNAGFLVHMIVGIKARNAAGARKIVKLLLAGKDNAAQRLATGFVGFQEVVSSGAMQQLRIKAAPGTYVLACFMDTQDGREHTRLGMERIIRITR